jgi:hypothetical protein
LLSLCDNRLLISGTDKLITAPQLYSFLKANANVAVLAPGCVKELDEFAGVFVREANKRKQILKDTEAFIEGIECKEVSELF